LQPGKARVDLDDGLGSGAVAAATAASAVSSGGQAPDIVTRAEELGHGTVQGQLVAGGKTTDNGAQHGETLK